MKTLLVNEVEAGIDKKIDELEEAYKESCKHNDTDENDLTYLRRYIFSLLALTLNKIKDIDNKS